MLKRFRKKLWLSFSIMVLMVAGLYLYGQVMLPLLGVGGQALAQAAHNFLSATHSDTTAASPIRGDVVTAQGVSPAWARLALGASGKYLKSDGTDAAWSTGSASGTGACTNQFPRTLNSDAAPTCAAVAEADQSLADNTTADVSTTKHGYAPKAPNDTTKFLRGDATWTVPITLNVQAGGAAIAGDAADRVIWSYTLSANTLGATNSCLRIHFTNDHTTGTAAITYKEWWNATINGSNDVTAGTTVGTLTYTATTTQKAGFTICNSTGTGAQVYSPDIAMTAATARDYGEQGTSAIDTTAAVVIAVSFNVASTDSVTPVYFNVEKVP